MTITLTIDTHPHTNALIPDQVRSIVEAALQKAKLGTVLSHTTADEIEDLKQQLDHSNQSVDLLRTALTAIEETLTKADVLTVGGTDLDVLVHDALTLATEA